MILDPMSMCFLGFSSPELRRAKVPCGCHSWFSLQLHFPTLVLPCTVRAPGTHKTRLSGFSPLGPQTFSGIPSVQLRGGTGPLPFLPRPLAEPFFRAPPWPSAELCHKIPGKRLEGDALVKLRAS